MRTFLLADKLNQLHWMMLKSVIMILAILPVSHFLLSLLQQAEGSSQIMIGFLTISLLSTSCIIAFLLALHITTWQSDLAETKVEQTLFKAYCQVPMLLFTGLVFVYCATYLKTADIKQHIKKRSKSKQAKLKQFKPQ